MELENIIGNDLNSPEIIVINPPSKMKAYPAGSSIRYKPYKFGEILKTSQSKFDKSGWVKSILEGVTVEGFDKLDMTYQDLLFIGLLRRMSTFNTDSFSLSYTCPECNAKVRVVKKLQDLEFYDIEAEALPIIVEYNESINLICMPLTVRRWIELNEIDKIDDRVAVFAMLVTNYPFEEAYKLVDDAKDPDLVDALSDVDILLGHGVNPVNCTCKECKKSSMVKFFSPEVLIDPFRESEGAPRSRIRFGLSPDS